MQIHTGYGAYECLLKNDFTLDPQLVNVMGGACGISLEQQ